MRAALAQTIEAQPPLLMCSSHVFQVTPWATSKSWLASDVAVTKTRGTPAWQVGVSSGLYVEVASCARDPEGGVLAVLTVGAPIVAEPWAVSVRLGMARGRQSGERSSPKAAGSGRQLPLALSSASVSLQIDVQIFRGRGAQTSTERKEGESEREGDIESEPGRARDINYAPKIWRRSLCTG